jgi:hypothetical protein
MNKNCGLCERVKECALVEVSTYDPKTGATKSRFHLDVCAGCADIISPAISAAIQSWCKERPRREAKPKNVKA